MSTSNNNAFQHHHFDRDFYKKIEHFSVIGDGEIGGKAHGLLLARNVINKHFPDHLFENIKISIPRFSVITTEYFDLFMEENQLYDIALSNASDTEISLAFQKASLSPVLVGDLWSLIEASHTPLAIRSSSLLEDAKFEPFAGVYATKMISNKQSSAQKRFQALMDAIKLIYASTFFNNAKNYIKATKNNIKDEKMAIIIQEVVGEKYNDHYYPILSGVARSYNFYSFGNAKPEDGVVCLALGLGKTIVDGGAVWSYSPAVPATPLPYNNLSDILKNTQLRFWGVNMGSNIDYDPVKETEYLLSLDLEEAEHDQTLSLVASTFNGDRLTPGIYTKGPRVIDFAPILVYRDLSLNDLVKKLLGACETDLGVEVEIEFALTYSKETSEYKLGFLQVRPMVVSQEFITITEADYQQKNNILNNASALGNGIKENLFDVIYVDPEKFDSSKTKIMAEEIAEINKQMEQTKTPYILVGFGRWGSSDPWLGIPVQWSDISNAQVIVEGAFEKMNVDPSQGSHFFHNINGFQVLFFSVPNCHNEINWSLLKEQTLIQEKNYIKHIRFNRAISVKVDGRTKKGIIQ